MHIQVDIWYSKVLVRVSACPEIVRRIIQTNGHDQVDEFHLLEPNATTTDLYRYVQELYSEYMDFSTCTMVLRVFTGNMLCEDGDRTYTIPSDETFELQHLDYYHNGMHCHMALHDTHGQSLPITTPCVYTPIDTDMQMQATVNAVSVGPFTNADVTYPLDHTTPPTPLSTHRYLSHTQTLQLHDSEVADRRPVDRRPEVIARTNKRLHPTRSTR